MARGVNSKWDLICFNENKIEYYIYLKNVANDIQQLKKQYPFIYERIFPFSNLYYTKTFEVYLIDKNMINNLSLTRQLAESKFSYRKITLIVPFDYKMKGVKIILDKELNVEKIPDKHIHFNGYYVDGYEFCAAVPESIEELKNVILENCRTAENYIIQIYSYINNETNKINIIEYSHGIEGRKEYGREKNKSKKRC